MSYCTARDLSEAAVSKGQTHPEARKLGCDRKLLLSEVGSIFRELRFAITP